MTENIEQANRVIKKMFSLSDPISLTETQRKEKYSFAEFLDCDVGIALLPKMLVISILTVCEIELLFLIRGMVERL